MMWWRTRQAPRVRTRVRLSGIAVWLVTVSTIIGCAPSPATPPSTAPPADAANAAVSRTGPHMDKTITVAVRGEPGGLAHLETTTTTGMAELRNIFHSGLAVSDTQLQAHPQLSERLPSQDEGTMRILADGSMEVIYHLRRGVTWDDGAPFTAHDMVFSWKLGADPDIPVTQRRVYQLPGVVEARDDYTLYTHWPQPFAFARTIHTLDIFPSPRHLLEELYQRDKEAMLAHPWFSDGWVGLGPYRLTRWELGSHVEFSARPEFVLGPAKVGRIVVRFIPDPNTLLTNLLSGAIDVSPSPGLTTEQGIAARDQWEAAGKGKISFTPTSLQRILMQPRNPLFQDARMRQALLHGVNRQEAAETLMYGLMPIAHSFLHPRERAFERADRVIQKYEYDPQRASQLLADLGWRRGGDGVLANAAGERLVLPWQLEAGDTDIEKFQSVTAAQWKSAVGIDSTVNTLSRAAARVPETQATFPGLSAPGGDTTIQNLNLWWHSSAIPRPENRWTGNNRAGWANPQADALLESILRELNPDRQQDTLVELAQVWAQDLPALPIWFRAEVVAISSRLQNAQARANSSGIYSTMWNVADWDTQ